MVRDIARERLEEEIAKEVEIKELEELKKLEPRLWKLKKLKKYLLE